MKKVLLTTVLALSAIAAFAQFSTQTINVDGLNREFRQYLPSGLTNNESVPLVIALHGMGDNMLNFSNVGFSWFADTARFICVFPQGINSDIVGQSSWNNGTLIGSTVDDIGFMNRLIDSMYVRHNIDLSRVYVCGFSMGAIMSNRLACSLPHRVAAIAPVCGALSSPDLTSCSPGRPFPVMMMNSTVDQLVPYAPASTPTLSSAQQTLDFWNQNNNNTDSTVTAMPDTQNDTINVDKIAFTGGGAPVNMWKQNNAGHQWLYTPVNDIDATTEIWLFFRDKVHPAPAMVGLEEQAAPKVSMYYNGSDIVLKADKKIQGVEVYDMQGKLLCQSTKNNTTETRLPLTNVSNQMLIVNVMVNGVMVAKKLAVN
jgi:polyhydroxybutyrate depolymerase